MKRGCGRSSFRNSNKGGFRGAGGLCLLPLRDSNHCLPNFLKTPILDDELQSFFEMPWAPINNSFQGTFAPKKVVF